MTIKTGNYTEDKFEFIIVENDNLDDFFHLVNEIQNAENSNLVLNLIDSLLINIKSSEETVLDTSLLFYQFLESSTRLGIKKEVRLAQMRLEALKNDIIMTHNVDVRHHEFNFFLQCLLKYFTFPYKDNSVLWCVNIPISFKSGLIECVDSNIYRHLLSENYRMDSGFPNGQFVYIDLFKSINERDNEYYLVPREICSKLHFGLAQNDCENKWEVEGEFFRQILKDELAGKILLIICPHD